MENCKKERERKRIEIKTFATLKQVNRLHTKHKCATFFVSFLNFKNGLFSMYAFHWFQVPNWAHALCRKTNKWKKKINEKKAGLSIRSLMHSAFGMWHTACTQLIYNMIVLVFRFFHFSSKRFCFNFLSVFLFYFTKIFQHDFKWMPGGQVKRNNWGAFIQR